MGGELLLVLGLLVGNTAPSETLDELLRAIPALPVEPYGGMFPEASELSRRIKAYGPAAIPRLIPLLESPSEPTRDFAGYVLAYIDGLKEEHLEPLIRAMEHGNGWIPPAIARIGTARAIDSLVDDVKRNPETMTQVTSALEEAGEKGALALARSFRDLEPLSEGFARCVRQILEGMEGLSASAIDPLLAIAVASDVLPLHRRYAVESIGATGLAARRTIETLRSLAAADPGLFAASVDQAIVDIGGPEAAPILTKWLKSKPAWWSEYAGDICLLRDIAELRENGLSAGSEVATFLTHDDHDLRVGAARTLGFIGYSGAAEALARGVVDQDDWMLAFVCAESLGQLQMPAAVKALEEAAATHWYPPVRDAARRALAPSPVPDEHDSRSGRNNFANEYFAYEHLDLEFEPGELPRLQPGPDALDDAHLRKLTYSTEIVTTDDAGEEHRKSREWTPGCGLRIPGGFLLGSNRGEWVGELVHLMPGSRQAILLEENVLAVHRTPAGIVAVTGLAHMSSNRGALYRIGPDADGTLRAIWWKRLPGRPERSGLLEDGSLFVRCDGGDVVVTPQGRIRLASER